jgi:hypothetical protein
MDWTMKTTRRHPGLIVRRMLLCLLLVVLLVWTLSQIRSYITLHGIPDPTLLIHQFVPRDSIGTHTRPTAMESGTTKLQFWQVGLEAGVEDTNSVGARSTIETRLPQQVSKDTTNYFWVGAYLRDGSFVQAGYYVPWFDSAHAGWFYCAFYSDGREGPCVYGTLGSAGKDQTLHSYSIEGATKAGKPYWRVWLDRTLLGRFDWTVADTGSNVAMIYAESSGSAPHLGTSRLGPVDFVAGLNVLHRGATKYQPASELLVVYNAPNVCPPYGVSADNHGGVLLGSGLPCPSPYTTIG